MCWKGLGAVLFRLITGSAPRQVNSGSLAEMIRQISEDEVMRPSTIKPDLKGDLENILLKALNLEPQRRYGAVAELADDCNRYLASRPVRATPDSALYRAHHFVRRHWIPLAATVVLIMVLAGIAVAATRQRQYALRHAAETRRLADRLLFEVHDEIGALVGGTKAREKLGEIAVQYLEGLERDHGRNPELAWELVNAYARLGQTRGGAAASVGETESGLQLATKTLALGQIVEAASPGTDRLDRLFEIYVSLVPIMQEARRTEEQRQIIDRLLNLAPKLHPLRQAQAYKELARHSETRNSVSEAAEAFGDALAILRQIPQGPEAPVGLEANLISTLVGYGRSQGLAGDFNAAVRSLREAIHRSTVNNATTRVSTKSARQLYWSHLSLGDIYAGPGRFNLGMTTEASEQYRKAALIAQRLVESDSANEVVKLDLARAFTREGLAVADSQPQHSLALFDRARSLLEQTSIQNHSALRDRLDNLTGSVGALLNVRDYDRARLQIAQARQLLTQMNKDGAKADQTLVLRAEAMRLHAIGQNREALAVAQQHLALLPSGIRPFLGDNFATVEVLKRIRTYSDAIDLPAHRAATDQLSQIASAIHRKYPKVSLGDAPMEYASIR